MPGEFLTNFIGIALACSKKYLYGARYNLRTFLHVVLLLLLYVPKSMHMASGIIYIL